MGRLFYLDSLRIFLTVLVVFHHAAIAYGAEGLHPYKDSNAGGLGQSALTLFVAVNQSFFMSAFFFLSGDFTPRSLEKKGARMFMLDRFVRLALPILVYMAVLVNVNGWVLDTFLHHAPYRFRLGFNPGNLWFLLESW